MICCILALLLAGPLGVVLAPLWARQGAGGACCAPRYVVIRSVAILIGVLLLSALIAAGLHYLDPPAFRHLCTVFR